MKGRIKMNRDLLEIVTDARSIRAFDGGHKITREVMESLVNMARLSPSARNDQPLKYKISSDPDEVEAVVALTKWAAALPDAVIPPEDGHPTGFITICHDTSVTHRSEFSTVDVGIAAAVINLAACERGFGACMLGSFDREKLPQLLHLPENCIPVLVIALGVPAETPILCSARDGDTKYFRNDAGLHFVPKRSLEEILIK